MRFRAVTPFDAEWCKAQIGMVWTEDTGGIMVDNGPGTEPVGCALTQSWTENSVMGHMAATTPMVWRAGLHLEYFDYVFNFAGRQYLLGSVEGDNPKALSMDLKFGFKEIARIPDGYRDGVDMIMLRMHRDDCRYLRQPAVRAVSNG